MLHNDAGDNSAGAEAALVCLNSAELPCFIYGNSADNLFPLFGFKIFIDWKMSEVTYLFCSILN